MSATFAGLPAAHTTAIAPCDAVMIFGYTTWSGAVARGLVHPDDRMTVEMLRSPRIRRLLVCNPYRSVVAKAARTVLGPREAPFPGTDTRRLYQPLRLRRADPTSVAAIERASAAYDRAVRRVALRLGLERPPIITSHPLLAGFGRFEWAGPVTYYATDDLGAHVPLQPWWPAYEAAYDRMRRLGRGAVAVSPKALASIDPSGPSAVIPNGIDPTEWTRPADAPEWLAELPGPRFLYAGTLDARVEVEALARLADAYPHGSIVLVGRCPDPGHYAALREHHNVTIHPPVPRAELASLVTGADVGLIPHVRNELTRAMSPLKLYEYLAAGLPVASVDLPPVSGVCAERVVLAQGVDDFVAAAARAVALGRWSDEKRLRFIHDNAWERRFEVLLEVALAN